MFLLEILIVLAAYLIGSLSAAVMVSKKLGMPDPRSYGSGNPGASNVLRSGRRDAAGWTLLGDALKGLIAVWIARAFYAGIDDIGAGVVAAAAIAVVVGHMWPVFFGFKGGKGVATALGVLLGMSFWATFWVVLIWVFIAFKFNKSSLAALVASACAPFVTFIVLREDHVPSWGWAIFVIAILVIYRHRTNIKRLRDGNESNIGQTAHNYATTPTYAAASAATVAETTHSTSNTNSETAADATVTETVAEVVEPAINTETEKADEAPLTESENSDETETDSSQADLRDGDALEEEVIQAAVNNAQAAQEAVAAQSEETEVNAAVETEQSEEETTEKQATPKKRGRKKSSS